MDKKNVVFILGSPRKKKNTYVFAKSLMKSFEDRGNPTRIFYSIDNFENLTDKLIGTLRNSHIVCFLCPLYADYLPYPMIKTMEMILRDQKQVLEGKYLFGFSQCAFPFWRLNEGSLKAMEIFGKQAKMKWLGGLAYGGAGMMACNDLSEMGKKGQKLIEGFELCAQSILKGEKIPEEAQKLFKFGIPGILKRPVGLFLNHRIKKMEKELGVEIGKKAY